MQCQKIVDSAVARAVAAATMYINIHMNRRITSKRDGVGKKATDNKSIDNDDGKGVRETRHGLRIVIMVSYL